MSPRPAVLAFLTAVLGRLLVVDTWWLGDDWIFLADAMGLSARDHSLVRVVSYDWYWRLGLVTFGPGTAGWALSRLALHGVASALVTRIAARCGMSPGAQAIAGMVFAAAPLAFEAVWWATGAVELLGAVFALWSLERWLAGGTRNLVAAGALGALSIFSKECGLLLPLFYAADLRLRPHTGRAGWFVVAALAAAAAVAAVLVLGDVRGVEGYALRPAGVLRAACVLGAWLITPGPYLLAGSAASPGVVILGAAFWLGWLALAVRAWRGGERLQLACLAAAALSLAPAFPLAAHLVPRYAYTAAAALTIGGVVLVLGRRPSPSPRLLLAVAVLLTLGAWTDTVHHERARHPRGRPLHRLVYKEELSRLVAAVLRDARPGAVDQVVFVRGESCAPEIFAAWRDAAGDELGPRVLFGPGLRVAWTDRLDDSWQGAIVVEVLEDGLRPRGRHVERPQGG